MKYIDFLKRYSINIIPFRGFDEKREQFGEIVNFIKLSEIKANPVLTLCISVTLKMPIDKEEFVIFFDLVEMPKKELNHLCEYRGGHFGTYHYVVDLSEFDKPAWIDGFFAKDLTITEVGNLDLSKPGKYNILAYCKVDTDDNLLNIIDYKNKDKMESARSEFLDGWQFVIEDK